MGFVGEKMGVTVTRNTNNEMKGEPMKIEDYDSSVYDTEAIEMDVRNGNFNTEDAEDYRHENIVRASLINGQFTQAKRQCDGYGLNYELELHKFRTNT